MGTKGESAPDDRESRKCADCHDLLLYLYLGMEKRKGIVFTDRGWYDTEQKRVVDDMGYSFEECPETRMPVSAYADAVKEAVERVNDPGSYWERSENDADGNFTVYEVCTAFVEYDDEEVEEEDVNGLLWALDMDRDSVTVKDIVLNARKDEVSEEVLADIKASYKEHGIEDDHIHYRDQVK